MKLTCTFAIAAAIAVFEAFVVVQAAAISPSPTISSLTITAAPIPTKLAKRDCVLTESETSFPLTSNIYATATATALAEMQTVGDFIVNHHFSGGLLWEDTSCSGTSEISSLWDKAVIARGLAGAHYIIPDTYLDELIEAFDDIRRHYNSDTGGYSASTAGDGDIYSDDDAQVAAALAIAYWTTANSTYLEWLSDLNTYLASVCNYDGYGCYWHRNQDYIATISQHEVAVALLWEAKLSGDTSQVSTAEAIMDWSLNNLKHPDNWYYYDGLTTGDSPSGATLSYHQGTAISAYSLLFELTGNCTYLQYAYDVGLQTLDRGDGYETPSNLNGSYAVWDNDLKYEHLLFQGYSDYLRYAESQSDYAAVIKEELEFEASYLYNWLRGSDGMYIGSVYVSGSESCDTFNAQFNATVDCSLDTGMYCNSDSSQGYSRDALTSGSAGVIWFSLAVIRNLITTVP
ncbi:Six-hairpin glycosidase-like protein [Dipodascopsis uninucleata]